ncbi:MAG: hypothetical protein ACTSUN_07560 [Promethearchaeota archaeon]
MKPKVLIISLTSCSGCISALICLDIFSQFLERISLTYFPFIMDETKIKDCDIALIEGCISEEMQVSILKKIRHHAKKLYALGTCAAFGGILSLSNQKQAEPLSTYVEINGIIPGCPPPSQLLGNSIIHLIEGKEILLGDRNLCATCPLRDKMDKNYEYQITEAFLEDPNVNVTENEPICFLKRGILCLGPITREGCDLECIKCGVPCEGCMGPVSKDFTSNLINFLSILNLSENLTKNRSLFYRFSKPKLLGDIYND